MAFISKKCADNSEFMLRTLGALWSYWYPERDTVKSTLTARGETFYQVYLDLLDLVASKSRFNIPIFKRQNWYMFTVLESQKNASYQLMNLYSTNGLTYQYADKPAYGDKLNSKYFSFAVDPTIKRVHAVYNRVINPSLILLDGVDYSLNTEHGIISFSKDPFDDPLVPKRDVLDSSGNVVDREMALWFNLSDWDIQNVYNQFGYALGIWMESSTFYKEFISAVWDLLVLGPTQSALKFAITALTGVPFAEGNETVVRVISDGSYKHVETDKNVYTFKSTATIIVSAGDELVAGQAMSTSAIIIEPSYGEKLSVVNIKGFSLDSSLMNPAGLSGPVTFENADVDVMYVGLDVNNKAVVQFSVSGFDKDVANFWSRTHEEGLRIGRTMADVLDTRVIRSTPTTPADLPSTINPFQFVMDHIFLDNLYLIYCKPSEFAVGAPGLGGLDLLYKYLPAYTTYLIFVEMDSNTDYYSVVSSVDTVEFSKGRSMSDTAKDYASDLGCRIRALPGRCR